MIAEETVHTIWEWCYDHGGRPSICPHARHLFMHTLHATSHDQLSDIQLSDIQLSDFPLSDIQLSDRLLRLDLIRHNHSCPESEKGTFGSNSNNQDLLDQQAQSRMNNI